METEIVRRIALDHPLPEIAKDLNLTMAMLESMQKTIMGKLQSSNIGGLLRHAVRHGILRPNG